MTWDDKASKWNCVINNGESSYTAWTVVLCTGFASKRYVPPWKGIESFKGTIYHTSRWPQSGVNLDNKRIGLIGTGMSTMQVQDL